MRTWTQPGGDADPEDDKPVVMVTLPLPKSYTWRLRQTTCQVSNSEDVGRREVGIGEIFRKELTDLFPYLDRGMEHSAIDCREDDCGEDQKEMSSLNDPADKNRGVFQYVRRPNQTCETGRNDWLYQSHPRWSTAWEETFEGRRRQHRRQDHFSLSGKSLNTELFRGRSQSPQHDRHQDGLVTHRAGTSATHTKRQRGERGIPLER